MTSVHFHSVQKYIQWPSAYHLEIRDDVIKAKKNRTGISEWGSLHKIALRQLEVLNQMDKATPLSLFSWVISFVIASPIQSIWSQVKDADFKQSLCRWTQEGAIEEMRVSASVRLLKAYENKAALLDLSNLFLKSLPDQIGQLSFLQELDLSCNQLTCFPESITDLSSLVTLGLSKNKIKDLPESFGTLTTLTTLDYTDSQVTTIPVSIWKLTDLTLLNLSGNQISAVSEEIGQLTQLKGLGLSDNRISALPLALGKHKQLREVYLSSNRLTALPETFFSLNALVFLQSNPFELTAITQLIKKALEVNSLSGRSLTLFFSAPPSSVSRGKVEDTNQV